MSTDPSNIELNLVVDSNRDRQELKEWFDEVWNDDVLVEDVKSQVLSYLENIYTDQPPQFVYYLTLFHIFRDYLEGTRVDDDDLSQIAIPDTSVWRKLYSFQKDGAKAAISKRLPKCETRILEQCGHYLVIEQPEQAAQYIRDFLDG